MNWPVLVLLIAILVACAPAETAPDQATSTPFVENPPDKPATLVGTTESITPRPTELASPEAQLETVEPTRPTATPVPNLDLLPTSPAKPVPTQEVFPMPESPPAPTPDDPHLQKLIDRAKSDLAQRIGIPVEEIVLYEFQLMTWPDASLGCPQPGMAYAQVTQDGYLIMFQAGQGIYNYHGGGYPDRGPFLCENGMGDKTIPPPADSIEQ